MRHSIGFRRRLCLLRLRVCGTDPATAGEVRDRLVDEAGSVAGQGLQDALGFGGGVEAVVLAVPRGLAARARAASPATLFPVVFFHGNEIFVIFEANRQSGGRLPPPPFWKSASYLTLTFQIYIV